MKNRVFTGTLALAFLCALSPRANAAELFAETTDTFISEKLPDKEFSAMDYLAVSSNEDSFAIAYLPFTLKPLELGLDVKASKIADARLVLSVSAIPKLEDNLEEETLENLSKIKLEFFAITDEESFDPLANRLKVSWDGEHEFPAPKHDGQSEKLDQTGTVRLGEIEVDLKNDDFLEARLIIFKEDALSDYLNFAAGIKTPDTTFSASSPLEKIEHITVIVRQISGAEGLLIHSADFALDDSEKKEVKKRDGEAEEDKEEDVSTEESAKKSATEREKIAEDNGKENEKATEEEIRERDAEIAKRPHILFEMVPVQKKEEPKK